MNPDLIKAGALITFAAWRWHAILVLGAARDDCARDARDPHGGDGADFGHSGRRVRYRHVPLLHQPTWT
jgi:hypothetical protein